MRHPPHRLLAGLLAAIAAGTTAQVSQAAVAPPPRIQTVDFHRVDAPVWDRSRDCDSRDDEGRV